MAPFRPRLIARYVFREVLSPTVLGLGVYVLVFVMNALFELAELAMKRDLSTATVVTLLLLYLPRVLVMTIPMAILLGVLVGIGRLSTDSEVIALRAAGISYWKLLGPALALGAAGWALGSYLILDVEPRANYRRHQLYTELMHSADVRREIKPRVFFDAIPGMLLYADEVRQGGDFLERVFIFQSEDKGKELVTLARRAQIEYDPEDGVARFYLEEGTTHSTTPTEANNYQVSSFERQMVRRDPDDSFRAKSSLLSRQVPKAFREQGLKELAQSILRAGAITHEETRDRVIGHILAVMHERFALPVACLVFAVLGVPLGVMNRRGGRASGFSLSIAIAIAYWLLLSAGENLVSQGKLSPYIGLWIGNALLGALGVVLYIMRERSERLQFALLVPVRLQEALQALRRRREIEWRTERLSGATGAGLPGDAGPPRPGRVGARASRKTWGRLRRGARHSPARLRGLPGPGQSPDTMDPGEIDTVESAESARKLSGRIQAVILGVVALTAGLASMSVSPLLLVGLTLLAILLIFSTTLDRYILKRFGSFLAGCLVSLFALYVVYDFIQLIDDLVERGLPFATALTYFKYRTPWIVSQILPMSCLVATLLAFGVMSRFNEVTALKASGTSIYRLTAPVIIVMIAISALAYVNQDYLVPYAAEKAAEVKDIIKGRGPRTHHASQRRWVFGEEGRLFNFQNYVPSHLAMLPRPGGGEFQGLSAYRLDLGSFEILERLYARTAVHAGGRWLLRDGWIREFQGGSESFETFEEKYFDFPEGPSYFIREWKSPQQMNYDELRSFVADLKRRGYDVQEVMVDLYGKMSFPLVSLTIVLLGLPFCFRMGKRGSLYGVGVAVVLAGLFLLTFSTTNALGAIGLLPPFLAAWAPNIIFSGTGLYLLLKTGT
jgi:LPS export ABC transporter permease LptG/LPS export ABC transporter permease LptF